MYYKLKLIKSRGVGYKAQREDRGDALRNLTSSSPY